MDIKILPQYQSYRYEKLYYCPSISPTDTTQLTTVLVSVLLIWYSPSTYLWYIPLLPQYQSYRYETLYYCPSISPTDTTQLTNVLVSVLLIWYSPSTYPTDMIHSISAPVPVLSIRNTLLLPQYKSNSISPTDTTQLTTVLVSVLLIWYSPSTYHTDMIHSTTTPVPVLLVREYKLFWYDTIYYCPCASPTFTIQYIRTSVPVLLMHTTVTLPVLLLLYSPLLSQYQSYWYDTVHQCPSTSPNERSSQCLSRYYHCAVPVLLIRQPTSVPVQVLLIWNNPQLPQYKTYW